MIESILFSREILTRLERAITICFVSGLNQSEVPVNPVCPQELSGKSGPQLYSQEVPSAVDIGFFLFPIFTGFYLNLSGAEAFTIIKFIGTVVALIGLALVLGVSFYQLDSLGILLATIGAIGLATVSVLSHPLVKGEDPRQAMLYMATTALAIMIVAMTIRGKLDLPTNTDGWIGCLVSNILYALGMITYFYAISMAGASATTFFVNLEPLVVTGAAFLLLEQTLTPLQLLGVLIVVGALIFYARSDTS